MPCREEHQPTCGQSVVQPHCPGPFRGGCGVQQSCCCLSHTPGTLQSCLRTPPHHTTRRAGQSAAGAGRVKSHSQHARAPGLPLPLPLCAGCASHTYHHKLAPAQTCCWTHYSPTMGRPRWEHLLDTAYTSSSTATISTLLPPSSTTCGQGQAAATTTTCQAQARGVSSRTRPVPVHAYCMHLPHRPANKLCVQPYLPACLQHP